jgi:GNAT superfamily N-acetyltransferase
MPPMGDGPLAAPVPLGPSHQTDEFDSGVEELDDWLHHWALVNHRSGNARVFVATRGRRVVAYYALATAGVEKDRVPETVSKGGVPEQVPCLLLARLAVDRREQHAGLGRAMLVDALRRAVRVSAEIGVRALLIHARDDTARAFYLRHAEFVPSPTDPLHLFLNMKHVRQLLEE